MTGGKRASFLHTLSRKVHMQFKRHPRVVLLPACTQVQRQNKGEKAPIKEALCSSQVGVKDWNKTFNHTNRSVYASGKYLMAGGETPSKQSREQRVGNTTAGVRGENKAPSVSPPAKNSGLFQVKMHLQALVNFLNFNTYCVVC